MSFMPVFITVILISGITLAEKENFGPFELKLVNWTDYSDTDPTQIQVNITAKEINKTTDVINGVASFPEGFTNEMTMTLDVAAWRNDSWVERIYYFQFKRACKSVKEIIRSTFTDVAQHWNVQDHCPIQKGAYSLKDFPLEFKLNIKEAEYGLYKARFVIQQDDKLKGCFDILFNVIPR